MGQEEGDHSHLQGEERLQEGSLPERVGVVGEQDRRPHGYHVL